MRQANRHFNQKIALLMLASLIGLLSACKGGQPPEPGQSTASPADQAGINSKSNVGDKKNESALEKTDQAADAQKAPVSLPVVTVSSIDVPRNVVIPGTVAALPDHSVKVTASVAGKLTAVFVVPGQSVHKGQIVAKLEDKHILDQLEQAKAAIQTAQANLQQARNNWTFAVDNLDRQKKLFTAEVSAQKDVILAENQVKAADAQVEVCRSQLKAAQASKDQIMVELNFTEIRSPIDGIVANRYLNVQDTADLVAPIVQIVGLGTVLIHAALPADSPDRVTVGQHAVVNTVAHPDIKFDGIVESISPVVDPATNTIRIQLRCKNRGAELRESQNVSVSITQKVDRSAILIPKTALVPDPDHLDKQMVYLVVGDKAHRVPVLTGSEVGAKIEIVSGLKHGDAIVSDRVYGLPDDSLIKPEAAR